MLSNSIALNAYNLLPGAAFMVHRPGEKRIDEVTRKMDLANKVLIVTQVLHRHSNTESIQVACRIADSEACPGRVDSPPVYVVEHFDYNDTVFLVGLVVNEDSWDDEDFGQYVATVNPGDMSYDAAEQAAERGW